MKRILFLLIIIFLSSRVYSQSGWQRTFFYNANEITSISKIDSTNIIAFTYDNNTCLRSSNSGLDWITYKCFDTICTIHDSKFTDSNTGWCVGEKNDLSGIIYKTTNGGFNWTRIHLDTFFWGWWCSNFINSRRKPNAETNQRTHDGGEQNNCAEKRNRECFLRDNLIVIFRWHKKTG